MAFEQPLEADHVDLNLVSILARAPVIGSLFFFFGGDRGRHDNEEHILARDCSNSSIDASLGPSSLSSSSSSAMMLSVTKAPRKSALKKALPSLAGSEISDIIGECSEALEGMHLMIADNDNDSIMSSFSRKKKSLSWSDYSGQNLVEYMDEESVRGPPPATSSLESASNAYSNVMTRSRSVRNQLLEDNEGRQREKSYLPKMQGTNHGGIVMPSMHNNTGPASGGGGGGSGVESPQWGWYINTTPPTPEMYHSCAFPMKKTQPGDSSHTSITSASLISSSYSHTHAQYNQPKPNLVFRNLQENKKNRINFPSVPV